MVPTLFQGGQRQCCGDVPKMYYFNIIIRKHSEWQGLVGWPGLSAYHSDGDKENLMQAGTKEDPTTKCNAQAWARKDVCSNQAEVG